MEWMCEPLPDKKHIACMRIQSQAFFVNKISQYTSSIFPQFEISHWKEQAPSDTFSWLNMFGYNGTLALKKNIKLWYIIVTYYSFSTDDINKLMVT